MKRTFGAKLQCNKPVEEHEPACEEERPDELRHEHPPAVCALLPHPTDVAVDRGHLCRHVGLLAAQPLQRALRLLLLVRVQQEARRLRHAPVDQINHELFYLKKFSSSKHLPGCDQEHQGRARAHERQLPPVEPRAQREGGEEADVGEDARGRAETTAYRRMGDLRNVNLDYQN